MIKIKNGYLTLTRHPVKKVKAEDGYYYLPIFLKEGEHHLIKKGSVVTEEMLTYARVYNDNKEKVVCVEFESSFTDDEIILAAEYELVKLSELDINYDSLEDCDEI